MLRIQFAFIIIFFSYSIPSPNLSAADLRKWDANTQKAFEKIFVSKCFAAQNLHPENSALQDWQLRTYCICAADYISSRGTMDMLHHFRIYGEYASSLLNLANDAEQFCIKTLYRKWGFIE